jgi:hypothetical protein
VAGWQNGRVEEWQSGRVAEWQSGRVAEWQSGRQVSVAEGQSGSDSRKSVTVASGDKQSGDSRKQWSAIR